jgi:hypothetical protein
VEPTPPSPTTIRTKRRSAARSPRASGRSGISSPHPPAPRFPDAPARALADQLIEAALTVHPQLDPAPVLSQLDRRVVLVHGFGDRLIPFTETLRLRRALPDTTDASATITRLFAHSKGAEELRFWEYPREVARYLWLLWRALAPD